MKRIALAVLSLLVAATAAAAPFKYLGFGDSITRASACPFDCSRVFDEIFGDRGGYTIRLELTLTALGLEVEVVNRGKGRETAAEGVSRIDSELAADSFQILLLMEGTNDVGAGFSTETIKFNLGVIDSKAAAQGVDTVLATIIRRLNQPNHAPTRDLKNAIIDLAAERNRYLVDNWAVLCPDQACFDEHYFQAPPSNPDNVGHPDASGYNIMEDQFFNAISALPAPGAPLPSGPQGGTADTTPTYVWSPVDEANWYKLSVLSSGGIEVGEWFEAEAICSPSLCSVTPASALAGGDYTWKVRGRNPFGRGPWSEVLAFAVFVAPPGRASLVAPAGDVFTSTPTYQWNEVSDATDYRLTVVGSGGTVVDQTFQGDAICSAGSCSAQPGAALAAGSYTWQVQTSNPFSDGPVSAALAFTVYDSAPGSAVPGEPSIDTFDTTPVYSWQHVAGAEEYRLEVDGSPDAWRTAASLCNADGFCSLEPAAALAVGSHSWRLRTRNPFGTGPWSSSRGFEVLACSPLDLDLGPQTITNQREFAACLSITAGAGGFVIAGPNGNVTFHAGETIGLENGLVVERDGRLKLRVDP